MKKKRITLSSTNSGQLNLVKKEIEGIASNLNHCIPKSVQWNSDSHVNSFVDAGEYLINGERTNADDGLPITNAAPGHTIAARLTVLDSTINSSEVCVTQLLTLSNRVGGDGNVYRRTGNAASKESLADACSTQWGMWGKLQTNVELGMVTSLDNIIDNGIYSGYYLHGDVTELFILIVLNNYAAAGASGATRSISQFKYSMAMDGTVTFTKRVGGGPGAWGAWSILNAPLYGNGQGLPAAQPIGTCYFDTHHNRPLWWNGATWVDALGQQYNG